MNISSSEPQWDHLRYFVLVARAGSVAAAARVAGVSHATVLRALGRLERDLGLRLFDHLKTGYRLTPQGSDLLGHAENMADEAAHVVRKAQGLGDEPAGELRVAMPDPTLFDILPPLARFHTANPRVRLQLVRTDTLEPAAMLDRDIRAGVVATGDPPDELVGRSIANLSLRLASRRVDAAPGWIDWRHAHDFVAPESMARLKPTNVPETTVDHHEDALAACRAGFGMALLNVARITEDLMPVRAGKIVSVSVWALTHPEFRDDARVRALMASLANTGD